MDSTETDRHFWSGDWRYFEQERSNMDPDFKDLLPWPEMSKAIYILQEEVKILERRMFDSEAKIEELQAKVDELTLVTAFLKQVEEKHWEAIKDLRVTSQRDRDAINDLQSYHN